jgi:hypothetical protein
MVIRQWYRERRRRQDRPARGREKGRLPHRSAGSLRPCIDDSGARRSSFGVQGGCSVLEVRVDAAFTRVGAMAGLFWESSRLIRCGSDTA